MLGIHTESGSSAPATTRVGVSMIEQLAEDEVFVFGSNVQGFHGAGSAGYAMRGTTANTWRDDVAFRDIMSGKNPDRRGLWAVYGVGRGYQEGTSGRSYAIPTVERPGKAGCVDEAYFMAALREFVAYATGHPAQKFLVVKLGANRSEGGYSYLGIETVRNCFDKLRSELALPTNIVLPAEYLGVPMNEETIDEMFLVGHLGAFADTQVETFSSVHGGKAEVVYVYPDANTDERAFAQKYAEEHGIPIVVGGLGTCTECLQENVQVEKDLDTTLCAPCRRKLYTQGPLNKEVPQ